MIYEAALLVCLSVSPDTCRELVDSRGPYKTHEACMVRIGEMVSFVQAANLFELDIKWRCKSVSEKSDEPTSPDAQKEGINPSTGKVPRVAI